MDDSERSYGYSEDIYHGHRGAGGHYGRSLRGGGDGAFYPDQEHWERSYEYGPEWSTGQPHPGDYGPEEDAVRTRGGTSDQRQRATPPRRRGFGRTGAYAGGESWTWDVEGPHRGLGPEGYRRSDDRIHEDVCERLAANGRLDARSLRVRVDDGEVSLEGLVPDRRSKRLAEAIADTVRGVVDVHNRLRLAGGDRGVEQAPGSGVMASDRDPESGRMVGEDEGGEANGRRSAPTGRKPVRGDGKGGNGRS